MLFFIQITTELNLNTLKIKHNIIKKVAPREHDIAKLKNNGIKLFKIFVENDVIAAVGMRKHTNMKKYFFSFKEGQTCFFIILMFKMLDIVKQVPIA